MFKNLSSINHGILFSWIPRELNYQELVFFPDACPSKGLIPTGTAFTTKQSDWRKFLISDVGCGMLLLKSKLKVKDFTHEKWDELFSLLKQAKNTQADLGSGNHFLDCLVDDEDILYFLIHTGSRTEGKTLSTLIDNPILFDIEYDKVVAWAKGNRQGIKSIIEKVFGKTEVVVDSIHNSYEPIYSGVLIRKGSVKIQTGEIGVLPSNMDGEVLIYKANSNISQVLNSMSHGTGRIMSRSEAKEYADVYDYEELRNRIYIPAEISNDSIKTEAPFCYREIDTCVKLIEEFITVVKKLKPIAYIGQY